MMEEALTTTVEGWPSGNTVMDGDSAVRVNVTGAGASAGASAGATDATAGATDAGPAGTGMGTGCRNTLWRRCNGLP